MNSYRTRDLEALWLLKLQDLPLTSWVTLGSYLISLCNFSICKMGGSTDLGGMFKPLEHVEEGGPQEALHKCWLTRGILCIPNPEQCLAVGRDP